MIGPTYTINTWGKARYILDGALVIYISAFFYLICPPFAGFLDKIFSLIRRFI